MKINFITLVYFFVSISFSSSGYAMTNPNPSLLYTQPKCKPETRQEQQNVLSCDYCKKNAGDVQLFDAPNPWSNKTNTCIQCLLNMIDRATLAKNSQICSFHTMIFNHAQEYIAYSEDYQKLIALKEFAYLVTQNNEFAYSAALKAAQYNHDSNNLEIRRTALQIFTQLIYRDNTDALHWALCASERNIQSTDCNIQEEVRKILDYLAQSTNHNTYTNVFEIVPAMLGNSNPKIRVTALQILQKIISKKFYPARVLALEAAEANRNSDDFSLNIAALETFDYLVRANYKPAFNQAFKAIQDRTESRNNAIQIQVFEIMRSLVDKDYKKAFKAALDHAQTCFDYDNPSIVMISLDIFSSLVARDYLAAFMPTLNAAKMVFENADNNLWYLGYENDMKIKTLNILNFFAKKGHAKAYAQALETAEMAINSGTPNMHLEALKLLKNLLINNYGPAINLASQAANLFKLSNHFMLQDQAESLSRLLASNKKKARQTRLF